MFKKFLLLGSALLFAGSLWAGCNDDSGDGPAGPQAGNWKLTITVESNGFQLDPEVVYVDLDSPEDYTYSNDDYGTDDCTVQYGDGAMAIDCHFEEALTGSNCNMIVDVNGAGTYTDTTFDYTYDYTYDCGAGCSPTDCATIAFMSMTVHVVGEYVGG